MAEGVGHDIDQSIKVTDMKMIRWIQGKHGNTESETKLSGDNAMVKSITSYSTQKRLPWYGHEKRRQAWCKGTNNGEGETRSSTSSQSTYLDKRTLGLLTTHWMIVVYC